MRSNGSKTSLVSDLRPAQADDAAEIARIDAAGLATGHASFRHDEHTWASFEAAFAGGLTLVQEADGGLAGWAGVSRTSQRTVYAGVGEVSVYVCPHHAGQGVGHRLLSTLITRAEAQGFWTLIAQIFPENRASVALHERSGFQVLGRRERLGRMPYGPLAGQWRDVLFLERRSDIVGRD